MPSNRVFCHGQWSVQIITMRLCMPYGPVYKYLLVIRRYCIETAKYLWLAFGTQKTLGLSVAYIVL